jgi:hypothetical protein
LRHFGDCSLPRGAAYDVERTLIFLACLGENRVEADSIDGNTSFWGADVPGGPVALAIASKKRLLYVLAAFDRSVSAFSIATDAKDPHSRHQPVVRKIALSHAEGRGLSPDAALGRKLFHAANDERVSSDGRACASCHPDGRDDGLVWPTPHGPRQTIFLAGRLDRGAPFGWEATHSSIEKHLRLTVKNLGGQGFGWDAYGKPRDDPAAAAHAARAR